MHNIRLAVRVKAVGLCTFWLPFKPELKIGQAVTLSGIISSGPVRDDDVLSADR